MKFHVITFGCQMNAHDSDWLTRAMECRGWTAASEDEAEVFVVNTCSVREKPEQKVYSMAGRLEFLLKDRPGGFIAVGGCVAQQVGAAFFERFPRVRLVFGSDGVTRAPAALEELAADPELRLALTDFLERYEEREAAWPELADPQAAAGQAFVNIMQGCDNFCAYCIVPYTRGRQKSRASSAVLEECRTQVERGARELTLLGQNVNSYGLDKHGDGVGFAELLRKVAAIPGLERLRFTTSHPKDIAPEVIGAFGELENLCPHLHLPLQTGSDRVLKRMGRKYDRARYMGIVADLRAVRPDIALGTDLIVGFPGETEEDFEATLSAMREVGYESSFSFKYSDRPGVAAERMSGKVDDEVAQERLLRLQNLQNEITQESLEKYVGDKTTVLFEALSRRQDEGGFSWRGRDPGGRVVNVAGLDDERLAGRLMPVEVVTAKKHSLFAKQAGAAW